MLLRNFIDADFEYIKHNWTSTERIIGTTFPDTFQGLYANGVRVNITESILNSLL